jgi:hypothetical protein
MNCASTALPHIGQNVSSLSEEANVLYAPRFELEFEGPFGVVLQQGAGTLVGQQFLENSISD